MAANPALGGEAPEAGEGPGTSSLRHKYVTSTSLRVQINWNEY